MTRRILLGLAAGLLSALVSFGVAYVAGVVTIAADIREFFPTVLAATTVLPLMLLFVLLIPTLLIGFLVGLTIGLLRNGTSRVYLVGAAAGLVFGLAILRGLLPWFLPHAQDDFISIISRPFLSGVYALFLGLLAAKFFRWFNGPGVT